MIIINNIYIYILTTLSRRIVAVLNNGDANFYHPMLYWCSSFYSSSAGESPAKHSPSRQTEQKIVFD